MMQDTVLNLCKDSVKEFVGYLLNFIPDSTIISSTSKVRNTFNNRKVIVDEEEDSPLPNQPQPDDLSGVAETKKWLNATFTKNKEPEPLYVLDLILKGSMVPIYSTNP